MLKNFSHQRGLECEKKAIQYFESQGYKVLHQRFRNKYFEVDVLMEGKKEWLLLEVKSGELDAFLPYRVSKRQKQRLQKAFWYWMEQGCNPLRVHLVVVSHSQRVHVFEDILV